VAGHSTHSKIVLRRVALVKTDVSENVIAYITKVTRIGKLGTTLTVTSNRSTLRSIVPNTPIFVTLMMEAIFSSQTSVLTRVTRRNIPEVAAVRTSTLKIFAFVPQRHKFAISHFLLVNLTFQERKLSSGSTIFLSLL
jgi:hypothetical protein